MERMTAICTAALKLNLFVGAASLAKLSTWLGFGLGSGSGLGLGLGLGVRG